MGNLPQFSNIPGEPVGPVNDQTAVEPTVSAPAVDILQSETVSQPVASEDDKQSTGILPEQGNTRAEEPVVGGGRADLDSNVQSEISKSDGAAIDSAVQTGGAPSVEPQIQPPQPPVKIPSETAQKEIGEIIRKSYGSTGKVEEARALRQRVEELKQSLG